MRYNARFGRFVKIWFYSILLISECTLTAAAKLNRRVFSLSIFWSLCDLWMLRQKYHEILCILPVFFTHEHSLNKFCAFLSVESCYRLIYPSPRCQNFSCQYLCADKKFLLKSSEIFSKIFVKRDTSKNLYSYPINAILRWFRLPCRSDVIPTKFNCSFNAVKFR